MRMKWGQRHFTFLLLAVLGIGFTWPSPQGGPHGKKYRKWIRLFRQAEEHPDTPSDSVMTMCVFMFYCVHPGNSPYSGAGLATIYLAYAYIPRACMEARDRNLQVSDRISVNVGTFFLMTFFLSVR
ncbi:hypothetical protein [Parapedobacter defluvii]|uniref:hypothetical protein n=1 Tax=Parapedobacter defluvii TaxID=2045106 RepID=UPI00166A8846|nr:hypothetical protein [Parapedobacter defluvii]